MERSRLSIKRLSLYLFTFCGLPLLTACGGGSDASSTPSTPSQPTVVADTTPDAFVFDVQSDTETEQLMTSSEIVVSGITASASISISGGAYSINDNSYTDIAGAVNNGDKVKVQHTSSIDFLTTTSSVLTIGGVESSFTTTTKAEPEPPVVVPETVITTDITFPLESMVTYGSQLPITGFSHNVDDTTEIKINGEVAEIISRSEGDNATVHWKANLQSNQYGNLPITVSASSQNAGDENSTISNINVPLDFNNMVLDSDTSEVFAIKNSVLYKVAPETKSIKQLSSVHSAFDTQNIFYNDETGTLLTARVTDGAVTLYTVEFDDTGDIESINYIKKVQSPLLTQDTHYNVNWSQNTNTMVLATRSHDVDTRILLLDLDTFEISLFIENSEVIKAGQVLINDSFVFIHDSYSYQAFDINEKTLKHYSRVTDYIHTMSFTGKDQRSVYVAGSDSIYELNVVSGAKTIHYTYDSGRLETLQGVNEIFIDQRKNQLVLHDSATRAAYALNLITNTLSTYYSSGRGLGPAFVSARAMDITEDNSTLYVFDDGFNGTPSIIKVDIATGNREIFTTFERHQVIWADGLVLNEAKGVLYVITKDDLYAIDLSTGNRTLLLSSNQSSETSYVELTAMTFDKESQQLYFVDKPNAQIIKFDLNEGKSSAVSNIQYNSVDLLDISDIALRKDQNSLLLMSRSHSELFEMSLENGELTKLIDSCISDRGVDRLNSNSHIADIHYADAEDAVYIVAFHIVKYDFQTQECSISPNIQVLDLLTDKDGRILASEFTRIKQVEFDSGIDVTISKR